MARAATEESDMTTRTAEMVGDLRALIPPISSDRCVPATTP
jgi:hypothetical protein